MSRHIDIGRLSEALGSIAGLRFAVLFGSARNGELPRDDSDVDLAVALDHRPDLEEWGALLGIVQGALGTDQVDLVLLGSDSHWTLQREVLKGQLLVCHDPHVYAEFFSLADRRGRDEEHRIARAWAFRRELAAQRAS